MIQISAQATVTGRARQLVSARDRASSAFALDVRLAVPEGHLPATLTTRDGSLGSVLFRIQPGARLRLVGSLYGLHGERLIIAIASLGVVGEQRRRSS